LRRLELQILFWSTRAALLFLVPPFVSDLSRYQENAARIILQGQLPYRDWPFEYPPLALLFMLPPYLAQRLTGYVSLEAYRIFFGVLLLPMDYLLFRHFMLRPAFRRAAFLYLLLSFALGLLLFDRFDLAVGFLLAFPFLGIGSAGPLRCAFAWGIGGALKLVPLCLGPFPVFSVRDKFSSLLKYVLVLALPTALACSFAYWLGKGTVSFFAHHSGRGVQIESLVASVVIAAHTFFHVWPVAVDTNFGAQHLAAIPGLVPASRVLFYGTLAFAYFFLWLERARRGLLASSWILLLGFVTFGYVLSPQFLLWLLPLGLLAAGKVPPAKRFIWLLIFSLAVAGTGVHFRFYWNYVHMHYLSVAGLLARNLLLVLLWLLSWQWMRENDRELSGA
jgi:hypothetical protein